MAMSGSTELKLDGYRAQGVRDAKGARLLSKNGKDFSRKYPQIVQALARALTMDTVLDGELVAFDDDGRPSFNALQNSGP
jgi:bifunctional non-homologous end joining protein LigD